VKRVLRILGVFVILRVPDTDAKEMWAKDGSEPS
jgi:hypothetical protein